MSDRSDNELQAQMAAAMDTIRAAALRLLQQTEIHPHVVVSAVARVAGELGACAATATGQDVETTLAEMAEMMREAGIEHAGALKPEGLPPAGSA